MFGKFYLQVPGGNLSPKDQDELIRHLMEEVKKRPPICMEITDFLEGQCTRLSQDAVDFLRSAAYKWLMFHKKE
jgi:hypothetical protein